MENLWLVVCEIAVEPGDLPSGVTRAFAKITTWGSSRSSVEEKLIRYLETYKWSLVSIEDAHSVDPNADFDEEVTDMIERTRQSPDAIILGQFHSYKTS